MSSVGLSLVIFFSMFFGTGCVLQNSASITISSEHQPTLSLEVNNNQIYTNKTSVPIKLNSNKTIDKYSVEVSAKKDCNENYMSYSGAGFNVQLLPNLKEQFVNIKVKSFDGYPSNCVSQKVIVDTTPPVVGALALGSSRSGRRLTPKILSPTVTDSDSGFDKFELKLVYKAGTTDEKVVKDWTERPSDGLFFKLTSQEALADYNSPGDVYRYLLRAYDKAGNVTETPIQSPIFLVGPALDVSYPVDFVSSEVLSPDATAPVVLVRFQLSKPAEANTKFNILARSENAIPGLDFMFNTFIPVTVTIPQGNSETQIEIPLNPLQRPRGGPDRNFYLDISDPSNLGLEYTSLKVTIVESRPVITKQLSGVQEISLGIKRGCARLSDDTVSCWGHHFEESVSILDANGNNILAMPVATPIKGGDNVKSLGHGSGSNPCFIKKDDTVWCLGTNDFGQLGVSTVAVAFTDGATQIVAGGLEKAKKVFSGARMACAISLGNQLYCWGDNKSYLVKATDGSTHIPQLIPGTTKVVDVGLTTDAACLVDELSPTNRVVKCWGLVGTIASDPGEPAIIKPDNLMTINGINGLVTHLSIMHATSLADRFYHGCVATAELKFYCWGANYLAQRGTEPSYDFKSDTATQAGINLTDEMLAKNLTLLDFKASSGNVCGFLSNHETWCWGGLPSRTSGLPTPSAVAKYIKELTPAIQASFSDYGSCILTLDSRVKCVGARTKGELGDNTSLSAHDKQPRSAFLSSTLGNGDPIKVKDFVALLNSTCLLTTANNVHCWGENRYGQVGIGPFPAMNFLNPTPLLTGISKISGHYATICAQRQSDGRLYCWGKNSSNNTNDPLSLDCSRGKVNGQTYDSRFATTPRLTPLASLTPCAGGGSTLGVNNIRDFAVGGGGVCTITAANEIFCWGRNQVEEIDNTANEVYLYAIKKEWTPPVNLETLKWIKGGEYNYCVLAKTTDSKQSIYCWGGSYSNLRGALSSQSATPVKIAEHPWSQTTQINVLSISDYVICYIYNEKTFCMGTGAYSAFPDRNDSDDPVSQPQEIASLSGAIDLDLNRHSGCAILSSGKIACWGQNLSYLTPHLNMRRVVTPEILSGKGWADVRAVKIGLSDSIKRFFTRTPYEDFENHYCYLTMMGDLKCWGRNKAGESSYQTPTLPTDEIFVLSK